MLISLERLVLRRTASVKLFDAKINYCDPYVITLITHETATYAKLVVLLSRDEFERNLIIH